MIYITKKMYKAFGNFVDNYPELKGINPFFNTNQIVPTYPAENDVISSLTAAGQIHKEVRRFLQPYLRPGVKLVDIASIIELKTEELTKQMKNYEGKPVYKGIGFPVGLAINECAAHFHPSPGSTQTLKETDIVKIDFGVEVNRWIIDSAFTVYFDSKYDILAEAVRDATNTGIKLIGIDVSIPEWGAQIQEIMESYEIKLDGKTYPIKAINNLGGHNIVQGIIHGGMFLPSVDMRGYFPSTYRFSEGVYAVETFGSTGANHVTEKSDSTLYRINPNNYKKPNLTNLQTESIDLVENIYTKFKTLPFTDRYVELFNINGYKSHLQTLSNNKIIHSYPPACVNPGAYTAQYEHTVYIGEDKKIVFSQSEDY